MEYKMEYRQRRSEHLRDLYAQRLLASVEEHDFKMEYFLTSLTQVIVNWCLLKYIKVIFYFYFFQCNVELSRKTLSLLATYEPRTFEVDTITFVNKKGTVSNTFYLFSVTDGFS